METGAKIDDRVGKLYLATLYLQLDHFFQSIFCLMQLLFNTKSENLLAVDNGTPYFREACKSDLEVIKRHVPDLVDCMVGPTFPLVFSKEDVYFVPDPLKFECATLTVDEHLFFIDPELYLYLLIFLFIPFPMQHAQQNLVYMADYV